MYSAKKLSECLAGLVGFRQNTNPDYPILPPSLLESASGRYIQDEHPLLSIENIDQALKNYDAYNYAAYNAGTTYHPGQKVRYTDGKVYEALDEVQGVAPPTSVDWQEVPLLAQQLEQLVSAAGVKVASAAFTQKKLEGITKSIFENTQLFDGVGDITDKELKRGRAVGFQIVIESQRDLAVVLKRIGTQFSQPNNNLKVYVYHSSQEDPINIRHLNLMKSNSFEWSSLKQNGEDLELKYLSDDYAPGGAFYVVYYEDDLNGQAINRGYDFGKAPACTTCNRSYAYWVKWSPWISVVPFSVPASAVQPEVGNSRKLWDIRYNQYEYTRNYGLNLDLSLICDLSDFLCRERQLFADAMVKQITVDLLNAMAYSTRNNPLAKEVRDLALYTLDNRPAGTPGATKNLENAIKALSFDFSDLNSACLPCEGNKNGPSWGSV